MDLEVNEKSFYRSPVHLDIYCGSVVDRLVKVSWLQFIEGFTFLSMSEILAR